MGALTATKEDLFLRNPILTAVSQRDVMERFRPEIFTELSELLGTTEAFVELGIGAFGAADRPVSATILSNGRVIFPNVERELLALGLRLSSISVSRLQSLFEQPNPTYGQFHPLVAELKGRLNDELSGTFFLSLTPSEADHYEHPLNGWGDVPSKFSSVIIDIEESSKCLALNRNTGAVFHLMRVIEVGLRALGIALKDPNLDPTENPTWERILRKCDAELQKPHNQRSPEWAADDAFFSDAVANLRAVKDAWRNPTVHIGISYDSEKASEVWNAVRAFMRHLASKLRE
jgi:hypothetical protein